MSETTREALNRCDPNQTWDRLRLLELGDMFAGHMPQHLRRRAPAASPYVDATLQALLLPGHSRGCSILRATVLAGGVTGELTPVAYGATPATTQIAVAPNGDIVVLAADAITSVDVSYVPERGEEIELTLSVDPATGFAEIPQRYVDRGAILLTEAESLTGTLVQEMEILIPASSAPATGNARLSIPKSRVHFAVADAVTKARLKILFAPSAGADLGRALAAPTSF